MTLPSRTPDPVTVTETPGNRSPISFVTVPSIPPAVWPVADPAVSSDSSKVAIACRPMECRKCDIIDSFAETVERRSSSMRSGQLVPKTSGS